MYVPNFQYLLFRKTFFRYPRLEEAFKNLFATVAVDEDKPKLKINFQ